METLISVIGGHEASSEILKEAEKVGRGLAARGWLPVCGGLDGVMEAVCRGAKQAGGKTVGILPSNRPETANPFVDIAIPTGIGLARNSIIAQAGEAVLALGGSYGTLSEIGYALNYHKPVIGIKTWDIEGVIKARDAEEALEILDGILSSKNKV